MATTLARVPSGALGWDGDLFGDDFDDVVAAVFAADGDAPAWLEAPLAPAPASKAAPASMAPRAAAPRAPAPPADGKQAVTPLHRCVNPSHAVPCAWCAPAAAFPSTPCNRWQQGFRLRSARPAHAAARPAPAGARLPRPPRTSWTTSWWATPARCGARSPDLAQQGLARLRCCCALRAGR